MQRRPDRNCFIGIDSFVMSVQCCTLGIVREKKEKHSEVKYHL